MINMKIAKFMFKFNNQMLPDFFNNYFTKLNNVHNHNTRQKESYVKLYNIITGLI